MGDNMKKILIGILIFVLVFIVSVKAIDQGGDIQDVIDIIEHREYKLDKVIRLSYSIPIDYINYYNREYKVYRLEDNKMILLDSFLEDLFLFVSTDLLWNLDIDILFLFFGLNLFWFVKVFFDIFVSKFIFSFNIKK